MFIYTAVGATTGSDCKNVCHASCPSLASQSEGIVYSNESQDIIWKLPGTCVPVVEIGCVARGSNGKIPMSNVGRILALRTTSTWRSTAPTCLHPKRLRLLFCDIVWARTEDFGNCFLDCYCQRTHSMGHVLLGCDGDLFGEVFE